MTIKPMESRIFGLAMARHLGIKDHGVMSVVVDGKPNEILTAVITVAICADDLAAVAERMKELRPRLGVQPPPTPPLSRHVRTDCGYVCDKCGSSAKRTWLFGPIKCISPQCGHEA